MKFENKVLPSHEQLQGFDDNPELGPIKMLNLIKLKKHAEYADGRETKLTGLEAYMLYGQETQEHLKKVGAKVIFSGPVSRLMIGEIDELWDLVAIAEYPNRASMLKMITSSDYLKSSVHREAALEGQLNIEIL
ncbi:MAG: DUF1330 domain-containing protein [Gammaproteobacteria bacterium TMED112]|nr:MAG: DUF1330 domain-containing protein [Gammaproteobacteria bacterium TMED112]|tara:strand:- start:11699 stop:12100 length:402 start_codon:yes stop_codon:yes gene_type:complete